MRKVTPGESPLASPPARAVLFPIGLFHPARVPAGTAVCQYWLTRALARRGLDVRVLTRTRGIEDPRVVPDVETAVFGVPTVYVSGSLWRSFLPFFLATLVRSRSSKPLVHLTGIWPRESLLAALFCPLLGLPFVTAPHGELFEAALDIKKIRKRLALALLRPLHRRALAVLVSSEAERAAYRKVMGDHPDIRVLPHGIPEELPEEDPEEARSGSSEFVPPRPYLLYLGRIAPNKALENLLSAMKSVPVSHDLVIAGPEDDPACAARLKEKGRDLVLDHRVHFIGPVHGRRKQSMLESADLLILPSHAENFGLVVLEALRQGTPVIASRGSPWKDLVEHRCGYWVNNDPDSLAGAVREHLALPASAREAMGERGRALVEERYRMDRIVPRYLEFYRSLQESDGRSWRRSPTPGPRAGEE